MSRERQVADAHRWLQQADDDLSAAKILADAHKFAQACFLCQQSAEKAVKAYWFWRGDDPWGHSVLRLIETIDDEAMRSKFEPLRADAMVLDRLYIPTRYPNGLPDLAPLEAFGSRDFEAAFVSATTIIEFVRTHTGL
jgi:HEPN domain-containing protein